MMVFDSVLQLVGNTPIVKINNLVGSLDVDMFAKLEFFNPASSVKDRIALAMIEDAESRGILDKDTVVVEPTSGNTGIGLAWVCAVKGYRLVIVMPENMSAERVKILKAFGAEVVLTPAEEGMKGAVAKAEELVRSFGKAFMPNQFVNPSNPDIHRRTTAEEIWRDTKGRVDVVVAGVGTGGTISGIGEVLKTRKPEIRIVAVEPKGSPVLSEGRAGRHRIQGIGAGFIPEILDRQIIDEVITVSDEDAADMMLKLARYEGILAGISSGAAMWAGLKVAERRESKGKNIVVILPDTGERYLSTWVFDSL